VDRHTIVQNHIVFALFKVRLIAKQPTGIAPLTGPENFSAFAGLA